MLIIFLLVTGIALAVQAILLILAHFSAAWTKTFVHPA